MKEKYSFLLDQGSKISFKIIKTPKNELVIQHLTSTRDSVTSLTSLTAALEEAHLSNTDLMVLSLLVLFTSSVHDQVWPTTQILVKVSYKIVDLLGGQRSGDCLDFQPTAKYLYGT